MRQFLSVVLPCFFALLLVSGALLILLLSVVSLGSKEDIEQQLQQAGLLRSVGLRFSVMGTIGLVLALATAALSWAFRRWHRPGSWAAPPSVLKWAAVVNLLCALAGCVAYSWPP